MKKFAGILALSVVASICFAQDLSGNWQGRAQVDFQPVKTQLRGTGYITPELKAKWNAETKSLSQSQFELSLRKDGTYTMKMPAFMEMPPRTATGTWSFAGKVLTLKEAKTQDWAKLECSLLDDGKSISIDMMQVAKRLQSSRTALPKRTLTLTKI